jgi:hypothetical protein
MKFILVAFLFYCEVLVSYSQEPTAAPKVNAFSLSPDNLGAIANSVNLHTGDLNLPLNLVSIPGRDGLSIDVSLFYNSANIENIVDTWNLDSPTGILGLGWSMPQSQIVVDNKQTGARDDDEFYLIDGGSSTRLVCIGFSNGLKYYKTKTYSNKIITYNYPLEKWEVTREDGSRVIYGDVNSNRNTVQWIIKWGNWIGSSDYAGSQQRQGIVWNISEVKNLWGEKIAYTYSLQENVVGYGNAPHTEASYLTRINDSWGREVELSYQNKLGDEYMEPHTEQVEPDAYQERYERRYLDKVYVRSDGNNYYTIDLKYVTNLLGSGNLTKRLLKSITKVVPSGASLPATQFDYLTSGAMKGALYKVENGISGEVTFTYQNFPVDLPFSDRGILVPSGQSDFKEPRVWIDQDYTVVTFRQLNSNGSHDPGSKNLKVWAYYWDGRWKSQFLSELTDTRLNNYQDAIRNNPDWQIATGRDFFALLKPAYTGNNYLLSIFFKNEGDSDKWQEYSQTIDLGSHDSNKEQLFVGNNFVSVSNNNGRIFRYVRKGSLWFSDIVNETVNLHFTTASNNYILSHNTSGNPDAINFYYLDELKNWQTKTFTAPFDNGNGDSYWHSANTVATGMIYGGNEYFIRWDENYNLSAFNSGFAYPDNSYVFTVDESLVTFQAGGVSPQFIGFRWNGGLWTNTGNLLNGGLLFSPGQDFLIWKAPTQGNDYFAKFYDPNTSLWNASLGYSSAQPGVFPRAGVNSYLLLNNVYFKNRNGLITSQPIYSDIDYQNSTLSYYYGSDRYFVYSSLKPDGSNYPFSRYRFQFLKNGSLANTTYLESLNILYDNYMAPSLNSTTIATRFAYTWTPDASEFGLRRVINYDVVGKLKDFPINTILIKNGLNQQQINLSYTSAKANMDKAGTTALYNKVISVSGTQSLNGYTETYFFNGLSETELGDTFPDDSPSLGLTAAKNNYKALSGMQYRVQAFKPSSPATLVSKKETVFMVQQSPLYYGTPAPSYPYIASENSLVPLPIKTISNQDGMERVERISYNSFNQAYYKKESVTGLGDSQEYFYTFAWEKYPNAQSLNILAPIVQTLKSIITPGFFGFYTDCTGVRWKNWPCSGPDCTNTNIPAPYDSYSWKRNGFIYGFGWWDVANETPTADWKLNSRVNLRGSQGIELEQGDASNQLTSQILDGKQRSIASAINAGYNEIAYTGFEDASKGNWAWADGTITTSISRTGDRSISIGTTGITKTGLVADETYTISFWMKKVLANSGSVIIDGVGDVGWDDISTTWNYYEYKVKGVTSLTIKNSGSATVYIDDLRFHPSRARMTTQTYHPFFGVSSQTDANNQTIFTDYDEFGRTKGIMDNEKNIISNTIYNYKKQ